MKKLLGAAVVLALLLFVAPAFAQKGGHGTQGGQTYNKVGGGYIPKHGPAVEHTPYKGNTGGGSGGTPTTERRHFNDQPGHPDAPHVHAPIKGGHEEWVGHTTQREDVRLHLDHPWEHGHWPGHFGRGHTYRIIGGGPGRFWFGGWYFNVFQPDWGYCDGWLWDSDEIVLYDDPSDPGWYLAYNVRLGTYVHVMYMGTM